MIIFISLCPDNYIFNCATSIVECLDVLHCIRCIASTEAISVLKHAGDVRPICFKLHLRRIFRCRRHVDFWRLWHRRRLDLRHGASFSFSAHDSLDFIDERHWEPKNEWHYLHHKLDDLRHKVERPWQRTSYAKHAQYLVDDFEYCTENLENQDEEHILDVHHNHLDRVFNVSECALNAIWQLWHLKLRKCVFCVLQCCVGELAELLFLPLRFITRFVSLLFCARRIVIPNRRNIFAYAVQ